MPAISKVLVANRGEIAVRIIQTCREMGIASVAVYSEADASALHVQRADEAYCLGPAPALVSYLLAEAILKVARQSEAQAIHPGYGFLAESAAFARSVSEAGFIWVGPPADVIALLGDKVASKELARTTGVPIIPGYQGADQTMETMVAEAHRIGYPVMIKPTAGGGGKGMRVVETAELLPDALEAARREAQSAFGEDRVFLEKLLVDPRHIEIQVLLDSYGNAVYLGERDCSVQRRHQKVLEESPSPVMTQDFRVAMGDAALLLARAAGYVNAGTVEFLFWGDQFYFLEMNTRLQVEHPVTEMLTSLDLVRLQLEIAAGSPLRLRQLDVELRGHAIEARLYAEDPMNGFLPATGTLLRYRPPVGPGIRNDVGIFEGSEVSQYYDPILAKLIVHADSRGAAVRRLRDALERYVVLGVTSNIGFLHWVTQHEEFIRGRIDTGFVARHWHPEVDAEPPIEVLMAAAAFELTQGVRSSEDGAQNPWRSTAGWRSGGATRSFVYLFGEREYRIEAARISAGLWQLTCGDEHRDLSVETGAPGEVILRQGSRTWTFTCASMPPGIAVFWQGSVYHLSRPALRAGHGHVTSRRPTGLTAPMPGTIVKVAVQPGQRVATHQPLVIMEAMKMEHVIEAPHEGIVEEVLYKEGDLVPAGSAVIKLTEL